MDLRNRFFQVRAKITVTSILPSLRRFVYMGLIALATLQLNSCKVFMSREMQEERRIKATQQNIQKEKDERDGEYRKQADRQRKVQDKATRKRMKELEKKSKRWRDNKPEPFYERWYSRWTEKRDNRRQQRNE